MLEKKEDKDVHLQEEQQCRALAGEQDEPVAITRSADRAGYCDG